MRILGPGQLIAPWRGDVRDVNYAASDPRIWLVLSACPLVWGWNPDDRAGEPLSDDRTPSRTERRIEALCQTTMSEWKTMNPKHIYHDLCVSRADGSLGRGNKMGSLRKTIHHGEDNRITCRQRKTGHKIQRNVRPGLEWNGEGPKKTCRWWITRLSLGTNLTRGNKAPNVAFSGGPPKTLTDRG